MISDAKEFCSTMQQRREGLGLSKLGISKYLGISNVQYDNIESGKTRSTPAVIQRICYLLKIRYNFLSYTSVPMEQHLPDPSRGEKAEIRQKIIRNNLAIWHEVLSRVLSLGLHLSDMGRYLGIPYQELHLHFIGSNPLPDTVRKILAEKLHMRIMPSPRTIKGEVALRQYLSEIMEEWNYRQCDLADLSGNTESAIQQLLDGKISFASDTACKITESLDISYIADQKDPQSLPPVGAVQTYNVALLKLIAQRREQLELHMYELAKHAGIEVKNLSTYRDWVEQFPEDTQLSTFASSSATLRENLIKLCCYLLIPLEEVGQTPDISLPWTQDLDPYEYLRQLGHQIWAKRNRLFLSYADLKNILGEKGLDVALSSFSKIEESDFSLKLLPAAKILCEIFCIEVGALWETIPQYMVQPLKQSLDVSKKENWAKLARNESAKRRLSNQALAQMAQTDPEKIRKIFSGDFQWNDPVVLKLSGHLGVSNPIIEAIVNPAVTTTEIPRRQVLEMNTPQAGPVAGKAASLTQASSHSGATLLPDTHKRPDPQQLIPSAQSSPLHLPGHYPCANFHPSIQRPPFVFSSTVQHFRGIMRFGRL